MCEIFLVSALQPFSVALFLSCVQDGLLTMVVFNQGSTVALK